MMPEVALLPVRPSHPAQDGVAARLQRHVQLVAHRGRLRHGVNDVIGEVARVRAGEAQALQPVDTATGPEQRRERLLVAELAAVGVHVLAQKCDFQHALVDKSLDLGEHVLRRPVPLLATQRRDDAERAGVVAAHADADPGGVGGVAAGGQRRGEDLQRLEYLHLRLAVVAGAFEQHGERREIVRAEHDIDPGGARDDAAPVLLR